MKTLVVLAAFCLVLATGRRLPLRLFRDRENPDNSELKQFEDDTEPREAYRYEYAKVLVVFHVASHMRRLKMLFTH